MALSESLFNSLKIAFWTMTPNRKVMIRKIVRIVLIAMLAWLVYSSSSLEYHETFMARESDLSEYLLMIFSETECEEATIFGACCTKNDEDLLFGFIMLKSSPFSLWVE